MSRAQTQTIQIKIQIDLDGLHYEGSGTGEEIIPQVMQFLTQSLPAYDLAKKLVYVPDLATIADKISGLARMTNTGQLLLTAINLPAEKAITVLLFMAQLAGKIGKREGDALTIEEISTGVGRAPKTIRNVLVQLQRLGLIDRAGRGKYRITPKGLMELERYLTELQSGGSR